MAKVFLTCFPPFKPLSSDELAVGLFSSVAVDLQQLQKSLEEKPLSLQWCSEAMSVIRKTHSHFLLYLERSKVPSSWEGVKVLDEYMRATLDLLDFCNLLKVAISSLDRHRMMVDIAVNRLEGSRLSIEACRIELQRLERENWNKLLEVKKGKESSFLKQGVTKVKSKSKPSTHVFLAIGNTLSLISLFIFCSILNPKPIKFDQHMYSRLSNLDTFSGSIQKLAVSFSEKLHSEHLKGRMILHENEVIEEALAAFKEQVILADEGKIPICIDMLKKSSVSLREGLDLFESVMNDMFEDIVKGRKQVIEYIATSNIKH